MDNMRIVRSVAASFFKFVFLALRLLGAIAPAVLIFVVIFSFGMAYADYTLITSLSELTSRGSELNLCPTF